jgi:glycosyltransferase involved in cell wall biosynthesis
MRIAILSDVIPPENKGGAGKVAWLLALGLKQAGHDVHVIASTSQPSFREDREGIPTYHIHAGYPTRYQAWLSLYNPQTVRPLRQILNEIRPDVVNAHNIHLNLSYASLVASHQLQIPTVFTSHDVMPFAYNRISYFVRPDRCGVESPADYRLPPLFNLRQMRTRYSPLRNLVIHHIVRRFTQLRTCVSEAHRQALEVNGLPPFRVVYNGIDPSSFNVQASAVDALRKRLDLEGRQVILFGGRMSPDKGSRQLLAALPAVIEQVPSTAVLVLGTKNLVGTGFEGPEFDHLSERYFRLAGWLSGEELAAAYHLADVVTMPSIVLDTAGMINLEAMAAARPMVSTCFGGSPEIVVDGETGFVINPLDTGSFADRLIRLLSDPDLRRSMGTAGQQRLKDQFTLAMQAEQMVKVYNEAISQQAGS